MTTNFPKHPESLNAPSELREDPITGRQTIIAAGRAGRPAAFATPAAGGGDPGAGTRVCPFDAGNERLTPPEIWADRDPATPPDSPGWRVRVVPNKYPAFTPTGIGPGTGPAASANGTGPPGPAGGPDGAAWPAEGSHEVVIHGPDHRTSLTGLPEATLVAVAESWRRRITELRPVWAGAVTIIANQGRAAGASLEHAHSQVCATAFRPGLISAELERLAGPGCAACAMVGRERALGARILGEHQGLVALCPWASIVPMEVLLLPDRHDPSFEAGHYDSLAFMRAVTGLLGQLSRTVGAEPAVNLVLHTAPAGVEDFHWHLHLYPRLTVPAGYELGTGIMINVLDPDQAAGLLRAAALPAGAH